MKSGKCCSTLMCYKHMLPLLYNLIKYVFQEFGKEIIKQVYIFVCMCDSKSYSFSPQGFLFCV